jgi:iron only hydrogenase large subunit-like protein
MFSGVVKIADIDDYITPSQNCIKPISEAPMMKNNINKENVITDLKGKKAKLIIGLNDEAHNSEFNSDFIEPDLIKLKNPETKSAKITLNDCLACSGCVTTAETLLIQAQSVDEFLKNSVLDSKIAICCVSPQSIMSIAYYYGMSESETLVKLCSILQSVGIKYVLNFNTITKYCLDRAYEEFYEKILNQGEKSDQKYLISSECPGWICYAEKKIGDWIIPYLSNIKSPQQVLGNLLKNAFSKIHPEKEIYISCIMPCFDKKLEATRENHKDNNNNLEVDTVISTIEILDLFSKLNINFQYYKQEENQNVFYPFSKLVKYISTSQVNSNNSNNTNEKSYYSDFENYDVENQSENYLASFFYTDNNFSSNGYVEYIIQKLIETETENNKGVNYDISRKNLKNSDFKEIDLKFTYNDSTEKIFSFAIIYGFRNIQNLIRNKNKIKYQYMEVMACPGGCINGGNYILY